MVSQTSSLLLEVHQKLPMRLQMAGEHLLVRTVDPAAMNWNAPFFRDAVPANTSAHGIVPFEDWIAARPEPDCDYSDVAILAHVSRCGSTLLARNIADSGQAVVLSEPPFFAALHGRLDGVTSEAAALRAALSILEPWRIWARMQGRRLVLKLSSQLNPFLPLLQKSMSGARFVTLHRNPLPVLESLERKRTGRLTAEASDVEPDWLPELAGAEVEPYLLAAASRYLQSLAGMAALPGTVSSLAYEDLEACYPAVLSAIGLDPDHAPAWSAKLDAKSRNRERRAVYIPVPAERLVQFTQAHTPLLSILDTSYRAFCESLTSRLIPIASEDIA